MTEHHERDGWTAKRSGRWHSRSWWYGHWDFRDRVGEYTDVDNIGGPPSSGWHWYQEHRKSEAAKRRGSIKDAWYGKGTSRREQLRKDTRTAQTAQQQREEAHSRGYKRERAAFYGSSKEATAEHSERRLTLAGADREARLAAERDREEAAAYRARHGRKRKKAAA